MIRYLRALTSLRDTGERLAAIAECPSLLEAALAEAAALKHHLDVLEGAALVAVNNARRRDGDDVAPWVVRAEEALRALNDARHGAKGGTP